MTLDKELNDYFDRETLTFDVAEYINNTVFKKCVKSPHFLLSWPGRVVQPHTTSDATVWVENGFDFQTLDISLLVSSVFTEFHHMYNRELIFSLDYHPTLSLQRFGPLTSEVFLYGIENIFDLEYAEVTRMLFNKTDDNKISFGASFRSK